MVQLYTGSRHLNPFTQIVWRRGRRRWMGLRAGRWTAMEQPAAWVLGEMLLTDPLFVRLEDLSVGKQYAKLA